MNPDDILLTVLPNGHPGRYLAVASLDEVDLGRDTIDLNSHPSRTRFLRGVDKRLPGDATEEQRRKTWETLERKLLAAAKVPPGPPSPAPEPTCGTVADPRGAALAGMPPGVRAEAESLLASPELLKHVVADIHAAGVVGESALAATLYLIGTSAQLPKPLAGIVRGASSSGKSFAVERIGQFFPPEIALRATSLTTNALYYFPPGTLRHRFVIAGERSRLEDDTTAEATRALREMLESRRLAKAVPIKEGDRMVTRVIEQDGPISYVETTTLGQIFEEDANRCLLLATDESEEQTRRIVAATAAAATGRHQSDLSHRCQIHFALQRMIPRVDVFIPFAEHMGKYYQTEPLNARRSFPHLLSLVNAVALLHFRQRERAAGGEVIATIDDYRVAERLARKPFTSAASGVSDSARKYLAALRATFGEDDFTTTEAQAVGAGSRRSRYGRLNELHAAGSLEQIEAPRGKVPAKWRLTGTDPDAGCGAPPQPDVVAKSWQECTQAHTA